MMQTASSGFSGHRSCVRAEYAGNGFSFVNANVVAIVRDIRRIRNDCRRVVEVETFPYPG